jgi:hypothetical protein
MAERRGKSSGDGARREEKPPVTSASAAAKSAQSEHSEECHAELIAGSSGVMETLEYCLGERPTGGWPTVFWFHTIRLAGE